MNYQEFLNTISVFDLGNASFNEGNSIDAFLFNNKWYPARAFVNYANGVNDINNHTAIKQLTTLIPYLRIKEAVNFIGSNQMPIPLARIERAMENKLVNQIYLKSVNQDI